MFNINQYRNCLLKWFSLQCDLFETLDRIWRYCNTINNKYRAPSYPHHINIICLDLRCLSISGFFDMRKLFPGTIQEFNVDILKSQGFWNMSNMSAGNSFFCWFQGLPALCVCVRAACGALATSKKNTPLHLGTCILWMLWFLSDFKVPW